MWCDRTASDVNLEATGYGSTGYESGSAPLGTTAYNPLRTRTITPGIAVVGQKGLLRSPADLAQA
ncbi:MAG: hypothetical protein R6U40_08055 [Desulfobacterales bacterium]